MAESQTVHLEIENHLGYFVISAGKAAALERRASLHIKPKVWVVQSLRLRRDNWSR
jgi:hypothetical protein